MSQFSFRESFLQTFHDEIIHMKCMSLTQVDVYYGAWSLFKQYERLRENIVNQTEESGKMHLMFELEKLESYFLVSVVKITNEREIIEKKIAHINLQRFDEIMNEMKRIKAMLSFYRLKNEAKKRENIKDKDRVDQLFAHIETDLIQKISQFKGDVKTRIESNFTQLNKSLDN